LKIIRDNTFFFKPSYIYRKYIPFDVDVSIIIVSYNVRYFLESCLYSVYKALREITGEVIVVDNNSVDGSAQMTGEKFPGVKLICNTENTGFARACNQGIAIASGKYVLLLNPDTLIEETTLSKTIHFIEDHPDAGAVGVKMIDGKGEFLPESKRALPTPVVAFYKIFGLSRLLPRSKIFNRYYLGNLDENRTHPVEILTGAFMMIRAEVLRKTGGLDEDFFMYGEDIDLCYRILKAGYKNYYFPETTIVHYKGESTKKGSLNYVILFYKAMLIFSKKHFSRQHAGYISLLIRPAIYLRAVLSAFKRIISILLYPFLDMVFFYLGFFILIPLWEKIRFQGMSHYPDYFLFYIIPAYVIVWLLGVWIAGGYSKPVRLGRVAKGLTGGMVIILVIYALLPLQLRFSRALILLGTGWTVLAGLTYRFLLGLLPGDMFALHGKQQKRILIISGKKEYERIIRFIKQSDIHADIVGYVSPGNKEPSAGVPGTINQLPDIVKVYRVQEIIFSAVDNESNRIIRTMNKLSGITVDFKVALPEGSPIVGSSSVEKPGELYLVELNAISQQRNKLKKRILDISLSLLFFLLIPFLLPVVRKRGGFVRNCFLVLKGQKSWVGYCSKDKIQEQELPPVREGVLCPLNITSINEEVPDVIRNINQTYVRNYNLSLDLRIIFRGLRRLGN